MRRPQANIAQLEIFEERAGRARLDELARALDRELNERRVPAELSPGPALAVLVASPPAVAALVECVFGYLAGGAGRSAAVCRGADRFDLPGPSAERRERLIEWLMERVELPDSRP
ncbi:hypothetical protein [Spirillospora sp. NPDC029432]|uniref:hypothetical protein n=1 Tax=Spirillospora sp. NPDC029432 TaxID=3154599 RepID=UPI00345272D1